MEGNFMLRITSENDLNKIITDVENSRTYRKEVIVCGGTGCMSSGNDKILENLQNKVKELGLENEIRIVPINNGCKQYTSAINLLATKVVNVEGLIKEHIDSDGIQDAITRFANGDNSLIAVKIK